MTTLPYHYDRVRTEATEVDLKKYFVIGFIGFFMAIGWLAAKGVITIRVMVSAVRIGYQEGMKPSGHHRKSSNSGQGSYH